METQYWRDDALNEALRGFDNAENLDALLLEVRRQRPGWSVYQIDPDRVQLLRFLQSQASDFRDLLRAGSYRLGSEKVYPYLGWYAVRWQGCEIEVALPPRYNGEVLCLSQDAAILPRFAKAVHDWALRPAGRALRYSEGWESAPDIDAELGRITWDDLVLAPSLLAGVRDAVAGFFDQRQAFQQFGFPWKRGVLLIGPPGTGKTMICKAVAASRPELPFLYIRDLREYQEQDAIESIFQRARQLAPCIMAFEDMDGFVREENRTVFLNELDGFKPNEGLLIIASSNHPGKIDEALLKRPSRFDRVFHIGLPGPEERAEYGRRLLTRLGLSARVAPTLEIETLARQVAERSDGFTPAYLKEAYLSAALARAQAGAATLDSEYAGAVLEQVDELKSHLRRMRDPDALSEMAADTPLGFR